MDAICRLCAPDWLAILKTGWDEWWAVGVAVLDIDVHHGNDTQDIFHGRGAEALVVTLGVEAYMVFRSVL